MKRVTIRVPATTANLGPGFDAFGCALSLYTDVTFEETDSGLEITGCDEEFTGPDNMAYTSYCAVLASLSEEVRGVKIHIESQIPVCRGLGSSAALLVAGAMGANVLRGNKLSTQGLLNITNAMEGHPDNLAPAFFGGLTASMVDNGLPVTVNFPLHPEWEFLALIPDFDLPTHKARALLPEQVSRADAIYNISHGAMVLKALELGDEKLLRNAMQDRLHQKYRKALIQDYEAIESLVRTTGAAFCLSGAGPTLLCITQDEKLEEKLAKKLDSITEANWQMLPLRVEFQGAHILEAEL
jgi:homoserine kinase